MFYELARQLSLRGHKVHIIKHKILGSYKRDLDKLPRIFIHEIAPALVHRGGLPAGIIENLLFTINSVLLGIRLVKEESIDLIHANNYSPVIAGWVLSKITRRPFLVTIHDITTPHGLEFQKRWFQQFGHFTTQKALLAYFLEFLSIVLPKNIHTVSSASKQDILKIKKKNIYIIPNVTSAETCLAGDVSYDKNVLYIGRLVFYKNLEVILKAIRIVSDAEIHLIVVGDGPMREKWQNLAHSIGVADRVRFEGYVSDERKKELLRKTSALVLPSVWEGFGIVLLEAWGFRKPVIVSDLPPLNQIVEHGEDGVVANPFKPEEWAKYISILISDQKLAQRLGENGYAKLRKYYNSEDWTTRFETLYRQLIHEHSSSHSRRHWL